jgi:glycosyltransferase involved in cell wall biosynthesis
VAQIEAYAPREFSHFRTAIVHDWLTVYGGAERVLEQIINVLPHADIFSLIDFMPEEARGFLRQKTARTSFIQRLPWASQKYRSYLPLMPLAVEQFNLDDYDLIISSTYAVAKGVITGPDQLHVSYVHSPPRYAWDLQHQYLAHAGMESGAKSWLAKWMLHRIRMWDARTANGVDHFLANSHFIRRRIWKIYRREADVIYPPVDIPRFDSQEEKADFYMTASRMVPYKRMDLIVEAFNQLRDKRLVVIGDGPEMPKIKRKARSNVSILRYQGADSLKYHMQHARAFVFAAREDFGIAPVEAQACGTPVIAYGRGGVAETVRGLDAQHPTGVLFAEPTVDSLITAIEHFEKNRERISPAVCRENAVRFAPDRFRGEFAGFLRRQLLAREDVRGWAQQDPGHGRGLVAAAG